MPIKIEPVPVTLQDILTEPGDIYIDDENTIEETYKAIFLQVPTLTARPQTEEPDATYKRIFTVLRALKPPSTPPPLPPLPNSIIRFKRHNSKFFTKFT